MDLGLANKRALITGASKGIGLAVAHALAKEGCHVDLAARDGARLADVAEAIRSKHRVEVRTFPFDLARPDDRKALAQSCGGDDILVNNAGSNPPGEIDEIEDGAWRASWELKVFGYINMTREFYRRMRARGSGVIVNVIGNSGERMNARYILGSTGNVALMGMTRALGARSPDFGVRVVGVNPGLTNTDRAERMLKGWSESAHGTPERWQEFLADMNLPFGRMGEASEVAAVVAFLASEQASYMSGTIVTVDGGAANRNA
jgi:NAD(P)-dependent dehydrogenase (short-subunit alcohol dehydrogenase family)